MFINVFALLLHTIYALSDSITASGGAVSVPISLNSAGFQSLFTTSTVKTVVSVGETQLFFMRFFSYDGDPTVGPKSYTAAFQVVVDDYSELVIPNSISNLVPINPASVTTAYRNLSMLYYRTDATSGTKTVICALTPRRMWIKDGGHDYAVQYREVLISVTAGKITGCDWAPSTCIAVGPYNLDSICAPSCDNGSCGYNITVTTYFKFRCLYHGQARMLPVIRWSVTVIYYLT